MKSPLKSRPLKNPGESVDRHLHDVVYDDILTYTMITFVLVVLAVLEWWRWFSKTPPVPWAYTFLAAVAVVVSIWKIRGALQKVQRLKLGRDGEKAVGQFLDRLRESGAQIFHDIPGAGFNLDHVVIHRTGLYVVETKTLSKPDRGEARLVDDGQTVTRNGLAPERNPIVQVRAARRWLSELVEESTGRKFPVRAVVVYPGWFIEPTVEAKSSDVWVLNPKALPAFISHSAVQLQPDEIRLCAFHLSRHVRTSDS